MPKSNASKTKTTKFIPPELIFAGLGPAWKLKKNVKRTSSSAIKYSPERRKAGKTKAPAKKSQNPQKKQKKQNKVVERNYNILWQVDTNYAIIHNNGVLRLVKITRKNKNGTIFGRLCDKTSLCKCLEGIRKYYVFLGKLETNFAPVGSEKYIPISDIGLFGNDQTLCCKTDEHGNIYPHVLDAPSTNTALVDDGSGFITGTAVSSVTVHARGSMQKYMRHLEKIVIKERKQGYIYETGDILSRVYDGAYSIRWKAFVPSFIKKKAPPKRACPFAKLIGTTLPKTPEEPTAIEKFLEDELAKASPIDDSPDNFRIVCAANDAFYKGHEIRVVMTEYKITNYNYLSSALARLHIERNKIIKEYS